MKNVYVIFFCVLLYASTQAQEGVIIYPVADLFGEPISTDRAHDVPVCGAPQASNNCPRLHQLLFNERVIILEEKNGFYLIQTPDSYFITMQSSKPRREYWTLKTNVIPISTLADDKKIPGKNSNYQSVILAKPWKDSASSHIYSAGTRFCLVEKQHQQTHRHVYIYDPMHNRFTQGRIPLDVLVEKKNIPVKQQYVNLIRSWIIESKGYIPYVWGGTSYIHKSMTPFVETNKDNKRYYQMADFDRHAPKTGFDCSGLVLRAAQTVGIPYQCKNSYTLAQQLHPIHSYEQLEVGDLLWTPGHVMIVSDLKNNRMIEARSYKHGYGKLHEICLHEQFKDMKSYKDLLEACTNKKSLQRLNAKQEVVEIIKDFKLLHLPA